MPKVDRLYLLKNLEQVKASLSSRKVLEQADHFVFRGGRILTFDGDMYTSTEVSIKDIPDSGIAVLASSFLEILQKLNDSSIELSFEDSKLCIDGEGRSGVRMAEQILLPLKDIDFPKDKDTWNPIPEDFEKAVQVVRSCAASDQGEVVRNCVHVHPNYVEATDAFQLARWTLNTGFDRSAVVRRSCFDRFEKLGITEFCRTRGWIHFRNKSGLMFGSLLYMEDGEYPNLDKHLTVSGKSEKPLVFPDSISEGIDRADVFSQHEVDGLLDIMIDDGKITVRGESLYGFHENSYPIDYKKKISFRISASLLKSIVKHKREVMVFPKRLFIDSGEWKYVTCTQPSKK